MKIPGSVPDVEGKKNSNNHGSFSMPSFPFLNAALISGENTTSIQITITAHFKTFVST